MKKLLLSLLLVGSTALTSLADVMAFLPASGVTYNGSAPTQNQVSLPVVTTSDINGNLTGICSIKIAESTMPDSGQGRWFSGKAMTITPDDGITINSVTIACNSKYGTITLGETQITTSSNSNIAKFSDLNATETLTFSNSAQIRFDYIEVDFTANAVATPVISSEIEGVTAKVSISCATEGSTIYYGFSADEITTEYTGTFDVTENCTVYAYAQNGEDKSKTISQAIVVPYTSFRDVVTKADDNEDLTIVGNFSVIYKATVGTTTSVILTDGVSNLLIYNPTVAPEVGTNISKIEGTTTIYQGLLEIAAGATLTEGGEGAEYTAKEIKTFAGLTAEKNVFDQIIIDGCVVTGTTGNLTVSVGTETPMTLYNRYNISITNGKSYKMSAFVWVYKNALALVPYALEDGIVKETVKDPVITPDKRELVEGDVVTITCETEDAVIYYTLDGTPPTQESTLYTAPFAIEEDATVMARAFYEGDGDDMNPSGIVSKNYHVFDPTCNVIDNSHNGGSKYEEHDCIVDGVTYHMFGKHDSDKGIMLNNSVTNNIVSKKCSYIFQKDKNEYNNENYTISSISIDVNENKYLEFEVRASNTPFTDATFNTEGVLIGTITNDQPTLEFAKDYDYFSFYPVNKQDKNSHVAYLNSVTVNYRTPAAANATEIPVFDNEKDIISDIEDGTIYVELPAHENWITKYTVNGSEETEYDAEDGLLLEDVDEATLHTITYWHEHYYHGTKTEPQDINHLTQPNITIDNEAGTMNFGKVGEGVKIYFTVNGSDPEIPTSEPANAPRRAKVSETDNTYTLDSADDATATHEISKSNTTVSVTDAAVGNSAVKITAIAVHADTNTVSEPVSKDGVTTSIVSIEATGAAKAAYDLMGRKVQKPAHGLYIIGGQKVRL